MQEICPKMNAEILSEEMQKSYHLRSLWRSVMPVTVHRRHRIEAAEGRWGSLTKCGVTKLVTVRRVYDGPYYRFVIKFSEVIQYPYSKSWSVLKRRPSTDRCAYDCPSYLPSRRLKRAAEEIAKYGTTESMTIRRDHDGPSRGPSIQPRFGRFPAIRILV